MRSLCLAVLGALSCAAAGAQPRLAADLAGGEGSDPAGIVVYDGRLFFAATASPVGRELWAYDPATGALALAADLQRNDAGSPVYLGSYPSSLAVYDGELFFRIDTNEGRGLWAYDAATGEAREVSPTPPGLWFAPSGNVAGPAWFTAYDGRLFYIAWDETNGEGLWAYDAATDEAAAVLPVPGAFDPADLVALDGRLYFTAEAGYRTTGLWAYDAATGEAVHVAESAWNTHRAVAHDGRLFFTARTSGYDEGVWVYDPATDEARPLTSGVSPSRPVPYAGRVYVFDHDPALGPVLVGVDPDTGETSVTPVPALGSFEGPIPPVV